nr:hypothetical protein [Tanacetum cinerariifolium]
VIQNQSELGEGSAMPTDPHHTPTILQPSLSQPQKTKKPRKPKRKDTQVPRPSGPTESVADEAVHKEMSDRLVRAVTTASGLEAEQDNGAEEVFIAEQNDNVVEEVVSVAQVSTAATTVTITTEEITLAQAIEALKTSKLKVKGIVFQEPGKSTTTSTIISSQQSQHKSKGIMIEEPVKPKKKDQIRLDEEDAIKLQDKFDEEERLARERAEKNKKPIFP